jgi:uncharacterized ParB-like nuclease family protein
MKHVTQIVEREGRVGPDFEMLVPVSDRSDTGPANILRILVDRIDIEKRIRAMSEEVVEALREDISKQGLLHPIGVKRSGKGDGRYVLIYGRHRLEAFQRGWTAAQRLLDERGDKNPEALKQADLAVDPVRRLFRGTSCRLCHAQGTRREPVRNQPQTGRTRNSPGKIRSAFAQTWKGSRSIHRASKQAVETSNSLGN